MERLTVKKNTARAVIQFFSDLENSLFMVKVILESFRQLV